MTKVLKSKYKCSRKFCKSVWGNKKDVFHKKNYRPGQHGLKPRSKLSDYGSQMLQKQLLKSHYGRIQESQFKNLFLLARKKRGNTIDNFVSLLETRLDIVLYRMNFVPTIFASRQVISHKHFMVNNKIVNIPSFMLNIGDVVKIKDKSKNIHIFINSLKKKNRNVPIYLTVDQQTFSGKLIKKPTVCDVPYPFDIDFNKILAFYYR